ncbi:alpha/beta hydrolase [uncultured Dialister sp.]|uniref:alpha/beta hydrolase n=1 Tax=uncultured Dialister sp. TaxID=278064 RepID=UPI0025DCDFC7|nr:alpha/beta hydrolase [uncultured Dialister sp.]
MDLLVKAVAALVVGAAGAFMVSRKKKKEPVLTVGESRYFMDEPTGVNKDPVEVYYYRPPTWSEGDPVFIAFPGYTRTGDKFRTRLEPLAVKYNMLIASPKFSAEKYPGARWYQEGNISDAEGEEGHIQPRDEWTFSAIDRVIGSVRRRTRCKGKVYLFGHSAGGQFMHRYSLFGDNPRVDAIICANSGWFTMPDEKIAYPYGMKDLPVSRGDFIRAFSRPVYMLMGGNDISRKKPFRDTPEADAQGMNRMERCNNYFKACEEKAKELNIPFRWQKSIVPGAAHEGVKMAEGAMKLFCEEPLDETLGM